MSVKPLWKTKTFYVALATIVMAVGAYITGDAAAMEAGKMILAALGGMALRRGLPK